MKKLMKMSKTSDPVYGKMTVKKLSKINGEYYWVEYKYSLDYRKILRPATLLERFIDSMTR